MSALPQTPKRLTSAEYLAFERESEFKHELIGGMIYKRNGANRIHCLIAGNIAASLLVQLRGKSCETYPSDMRVRTPMTNSYVYPDITIVCGELHFDDDRGDVLTNPTLVIEVLSPHTERFDRGKKFQHYRKIPSLKEYVLIAQDQPRIEHYLRQADGLWQFSDAQGLEATLDLSSIGCRLALAEVYERGSFGEDDNTAD